MWAIKCNVQLNTSQSKKVRRYCQHSDNEGGAVESVMFPVLLDLIFHSVLSASQARVPVFIYYYKNISIV